MRNILIKGAPATGKTAFSRAMAYYVCAKGESPEDAFSHDITADAADIERFIQTDRAEFIQVHPSMSYEDIVYGIEIKASGSVSMAYAEKRVKALCDRAKGKSDRYCIILDDITRTNAGALLGNLLYAMEYRGEAVELSDGAELTVPENVVFIVTACEQPNSAGIEYALRRRFDYYKELSPDRAVLERYYSALPQSFSDIILGVFDAAADFVVENLVAYPSVRRENYVAGHGMFLVDRGGTYFEILRNYKDRFRFQVFPYIVSLKSAGIIGAADTDAFFDKIDSMINLGAVTQPVITGVEKKFFRSVNATLPFSLSDSEQYFKQTVIPKGCGEHRTIIECCIDAMLCNGILPLDIVFNDVLTNTNVVQFESRQHKGKYAAFICKTSENGEYGYLSTNSNGVRSYYSTNGAKTGRWADKADAPIYTFDKNGTAESYVSLNALRNSGLDVSCKVIHAQENTASIFSAFYLLVKAYLDRLRNALAILASSDKSYSDMYSLAKMESAYWKDIAVVKNRVKGKDKKLIFLCKCAANLRLLWNPAGTLLSVDRNKPGALLNGGTLIAVDKQGNVTDSYSNIYNCQNPSSTIQIEIKEVPLMSNNSDYRQLMDNIGVRQMIFQGPPGTSKTFEAKRFVLNQLDPSSTAATQADITAALGAFKLTDSDYANPAASGRLKTGGWDLVQFHPSYGYEDFIRGIEVKPQNNSPVYQSVNRILGKIADFAAYAEKNGSEGKFYLIIDEINRANLATVFGELIYGLEYRDSPVSTPYEVTGANGTSKDITLGKNLYIIGTMNTADKSIDAIDYAIRRRFIFIDSPARREVVLNCYRSVSGNNDENSVELLLFDAVSALFDSKDYFNDEYQKSDVKLGHTYFLRTSAAGFEEIAKQRFIYQVIPILREYVKDGILVSEDTPQESRAGDIAAQTDPDKRTEMLRDNIMLYITRFGDKQGAAVIDNDYIDAFLDELFAGLGW